MNKPKKWITTAASCLLALLLIAGIGYLASLKENLSAEALEMSYLPASQVGLGEAIEATGILTSPIQFSPDKVKVAAPENTVLAGQPEIRFSVYLWNEVRYRVSFRLRALAPGETRNGSVIVTFHNAEPLTVMLPAFRVLPGKSGEGLPEPAGKLEMPPSVPNWIYWAVGLVLAAALTAFCLLRRRTRLQGAIPAAPPWVRAKEELARLKDGVRSRRIGLESAFVRLTDLVRNYLEERYDIPASTLTTDEFMDSLRGHDAPVPAAERPFIGEFLTVADQVKFARLEPDETQLLAAVGGAEALVDHTAPKEPGEEGGKHV